MYFIQTRNNIAPKGLAELPAQQFAVNSGAESDVQGILVRSAAMHDTPLPEGLLAIARAGAGVNNIPVPACSEKGIVVFNTPGANANGVKELAIAGMLLAARDIIGGINWVQEYEEDGDIAKITEKKKKAFAGTEIQGKKLGVIGLGAIGVQVANAAVNLGMEVYGYDPYVSVASAWNLSRSIHHAETVDELYNVCDYITIHVPALDDTKGMIDKHAISLMKDGVVILNLARDVLVNQEDIVDALVAGKVRCYVTDFPTKEIVGVKGAIVIPHLGASTEESEDNCARMAAEELKDFLENGNIAHSVNYPDCNMGVKGEGARLTILHKNIPNMLGQLTSILAGENVNIALMTNKSRKAYAYTMMDVDGDVPAETEEKLAGIDGVLKVRVIR